MILVRYAFAVGGFLPVRHSHLGSNPRTMLYKPNFCCNCGEKIDRTEWSLFSSRRFCALCETENKGHDYFVRAIVAVGVILGLFGASSWIHTADEPYARLDSGGAAGSRANPAPPKAVSNVSGSDSRLVNTRAPVADPGAGMPANAARDARPTKPNDAVYYCQAITKKGTRCTRRIKSPGFCWQHAKSPLSAGLQNSR